MLYINYISIKLENKTKHYCASDFSYIYENKTLYIKDHKIKKKLCASNSMLLYSRYLQKLVFFSFFGITYSSIFQNLEYRFYSLLVGMFEVRIQWLTVLGNTGIKLNLNNFSSESSICNASLVKYTSQISSNTFDRRCLVFMECL